MGILRAISSSIESTFMDQWKEIITAGEFDEHTIVTPGVIKRTNNGWGENLSGSVGVISNGSKIFVPENTAAVIFSQSGIENIITIPGGYDFQSGEKSIFNGDGIANTIIGQVANRIGFGGQTASQKEVAYINLREIRDIKFGTRGPLLYNDLYYGTDLEILAYGTFSVQIVDPEKVVKNFLPPKVKFYSFKDKDAKAQIMAEFMQSFAVGLNSLSATNRISQLLSKSSEIAERIISDPLNVGTWRDRFGFRIIKVGIINIEFSATSKDLVNGYSLNKMNMKAYDEISYKASNIRAQQVIAQGIKENGFGDNIGFIYGMNFAQNLGVHGEEKTTMTINQQIEAVKKLKELLDEGILTQEEFEVKKREIMRI